MGEGDEGRRMFGMRPADFLAPRCLEVTDLPVRRVQLIGGCYFDNWPYALRDLYPSDRIDRLVFGNIAPEAMQSDCDLRIVQFPLRNIYGEWHTMPLPYEDANAAERLLASAPDALRYYLSSLVDATPGVPTFYLNYATPLQNPFGRLLPRYDVRNPIHFVERLNQLVAEFVASLPNWHVLDADHAASVFGRRFMQDDPYWVTGHGGFITDIDWHLDQGRLEPDVPLSQRLDHDPDGFVRLLWGEAMAMLRTLRGTDRIKMVCVDLDDTMWRGVQAEQGQADHGALEGWPIGFAEALRVLHKRGVILAIVSKNDPDFIEAVFPKLFGDRLPLTTFPIRKIGWGPKPEALIEAITEANVLPESVLFIDDNPVERERARAAIPGLRVLGGPHLDWRRILLWSPELQLPTLSDEAIRRNAMIAAQVEREQVRTAQSPEDFLGGLGVEIAFGTIADRGDDGFARALELVNKTNQFNTTGHRWTAEEAEAWFATGGVWLHASVSDRFTRYGLVAVAMLRDGCIEQMVMSCRVFGLGIEQALIAEAARVAGGDRLRARLERTERNGPCQNAFRTLGWQEEDGTWHAAAPPAMPGHIAIAGQSVAPVAA